MAKVNIPDNGLWAAIAQLINDNFADGTFTVPVVIEVPLPTAARLDLRNVEGGFSVIVDNDVVILRRTDSGGVDKAGPLILQGASITALYMAGSDTAEFIIDGADSQKVRRSGGDHLIISQLEYDLLLARVTALEAFH